MVNNELCNPGVYTNGYSVDVYTLCVMQTGGVGECYTSVAFLYAPVYQYTLCVGPNKVSIYVCSRVHHLACIAQPPGHPVWPCT